MELIGAQKRLTRKFNKAFGFLVAMNVVYATPYYALHLVDVVQIPGLMNRLSMLTYIGLWGSTCRWAIDILVMVICQNFYDVCQRLTECIFCRPSGGSDGWFGEAMK